MASDSEERQCKEPGVAVFWVLYEFQWSHTARKSHAVVNCHTVEIQQT